MRKLTEAEAVARLKRGKAAFQTHIKLTFEHRALDCRACPTPGVCCTDAHFVNVHITRLEAVAISDTLALTFSCPLFQKGVGCLVHQRAKPAPCVQHACYEDWADVPPLDTQWREERRIERLNDETYGAAWEWLPIPVWLTLVDPDSDGAELRRLASVWG